MKTLKIRDLTLRDGQQSAFATRMTNDAALFFAEKIFAANLGHLRRSVNFSEKFSTMRVYNSIFFHKRE